MTAMTPQCFIQKWRDAVLTERTAAQSHFNDLCALLGEPTPTDAWWNCVPEVVPGYPDRLLPVDDRAATELKKRTLTHLYNQRPAWLANAHRVLDEAVAAVYGWPANSSDEEISWRLLALNRERASTQSL